MLLQKFHCFGLTWTFRPRGLPLLPFNCFFFLSFHSFPFGLILSYGLDNFWRQNERWVEIDQLIRVFILYMGSSAQIFSTNKSFMGRFCIPHYYHYLVFVLSSFDLYFQVPTWFLAGTCRPENVVIPRHYLTTMQMYRVPPSLVPLLGPLKYQIKPRELMKVFDDDGKVVDRRANYKKVASKNYHSSFSYWFTPYF